jgi:uroporphyrin-3 C-methyltransferase
MSDTNTEQQPGNPAEETRDSGASVSAPSANHEHGAGREQRGPGAQPGAERRRRGGSAAGFFALLALLVALAAAGVSAWQAYQLRQVTSALEVDMARKLAEIETIGSDSRRLSSGARDIARDVEARLGQLEARIVGIQNDRLAMETLYQELSQSRDEWTLAEVEQILLVASQQLQLAGNVKAALAALEAADARLAKSDRPQLTALRRVIAEDIDRLKASPFVDVTGIGLKLERMIGGINDWPLAMQARPVAAERSASAAAPGWRR